LINKAKVALTKLDTIIEENKKGFVVGDHVTIADLQIFFETASFAGALQFDLSEFKSLAKWFNDVKEAHEIISRNLTSY